MATSAITAGAALYGAYAQNEAGRQQQKIANRNAELLDASAADAIQRGEEQARQVKRQARSLRGRQRAAAAGGGVDVNSGTALDLQEETTALGEIDAATLRKNAFREAWGIRMQASNQREAGAFAKRTGRNQAIGTLIGGAGQTYKDYYSYDAPKVKAS